MTRPGRVAAFNRALASFNESQWQSLPPCWRRAALQESFAVKFTVELILSFLELGCKICVFDFQIGGIFLEENKQ